MKILKKLGMGALLCVAMFLAGCMAASMKISSVTPPSPQTAEQAKYKFNLTKVSTHTIKNDSTDFSLWEKFNGDNILASLQASAHPQLGGSESIPLEIKITRRKTDHISPLYMLGVLNLATVIPMRYESENLLIVEYIFGTYETAYQEVRCLVTLNEVDALSFIPFWGIAYLFALQENSFIHEFYDANFIDKKVFTDAILQGLTYYNPKALVKGAKKRESASHLAPKNGVEIIKTSSPNTTTIRGTSFEQTYFHDENSFVKMSSSVDFNKMREEEAQKAKLKEGEKK